MAITFQFFLCTSQYLQSLFHIYASFIPSTHKLEVFGNFILIKFFFKKRVSWLTGPLFSVTTSLWSWETTAKQLGCLSELEWSIRVYCGICYSDKNRDFTNAKIINSSKVRKPRRCTELHMTADVCFENTSILAYFARYQVPQAPLSLCWISLCPHTKHNCKDNLIRAQTLSDNLFPGELAISFSS